MRNLFKLLVVAVSLVLASCLICSVAKAAPRAHKSWTIKDRLEWNSLCKESLTKAIAEKNSQPDPQKVATMCDCLSGELQYQMTPDEYYRFDQTPTPFFLKAMNEAFMSCLRGPA